MSVGTSLSDPDHPYSNIFCHKVSISTEGSFFYGSSSGAGPQQGNILQSDAEGNAAWVTPAQVLASIGISSVLQSVETEIVGPWTGSLPYLFVLTKQTLGFGPSGHSVCILRMPKMIQAATSTSSIFPLADIPVEFRPVPSSGSAALTYTIPVENSDVGEQGMLEILIDGSIVIYKDAASSDFDSTGNAGFQDIFITWFLA